MKFYLIFLFGVYFFCFPLFLSAQGEELKVKIEQNGGKWVVYKGWRDGVENNFEGDIWTKYNGKDEYPLRIGKFMVSNEENEIGEKHCTITIKRKSETFPLDKVSWEKWAEFYYKLIPLPSEKEVLERLEESDKTLNLKQLIANKIPPNGREIFQNNLVKLLEEGYYDKDDEKNLKMLLKLREASNSTGFEILKENLKNTIDSKQRIFIKNGEKYFDEGELKKSCLQFEKVFILNAGLYVEIAENVASKIMTNGSKSAFVAEIKDERFRQQVIEKIISKLPGDDTQKNCRKGKDQLENILNHVKGDELVEQRLRHILNNLKNKLATYILTDVEGMIEKKQYDRAEEHLIEILRLEPLENDVKRRLNILENILSFEKALQKGDLTNCIEIFLRQPELSDKRKKEFEEKILSSLEKNKEKAVEIRQIVLKPQNKPKFSTRFLYKYDMFLGKYAEEKKILKDAVNNYEEARKLMSELKLGNTEEFVNLKEKIKSLELKLNPPGELEDVKEKLIRIKQINIPKDERHKLFYEIINIIKISKNLEIMSTHFNELSNQDEYEKQLKKYFFENLTREKFRRSDINGFKRIFPIYEKLVNRVETDIYEMYEKIKIMDKNGILEFADARKAIRQRISNVNKNEKGMWEIELPGNGIKFVFIPAGLYSIKNKRKPTFVESFFIGKYEVTKSHYQEYCTGKNIRFEINRDKVNHPVVKVTWKDANRFCEWLAKKTGLEIDLPTSSQWEMAAASGKNTDYFWGVDFLWYWGNSGGHTNEIGKKLPNEWGIYDILGNAAEWAKDSHQGNPSQKIIRGGHWDSQKSYVKIIPPKIETKNIDKKAPTIGFRLVINLKNIKLRKE
jgi:formylglycine-generating enzyme required for sulfatase activity